MRLFHSKKKDLPETKQYDPNLWEPAMRCSICTGEKVFGFRQRGGGTFEEAGLVTGEADLARYCAQYGVRSEDIIKFY